MEAAESFEFSGHGAIHLGQVHDVVERIFDLRISERTAAPIGERIGFLQFYATLAHNERSVANLQRAAEQRRGDLRVENWLGKHAELVVDDFEVLRCGMEQLHDFFVREKLFERLEAVKGERVNGDAFLLGAHLNEAELGPVCFLAEEFGVDREHFADAGAVDELFQLLASSDVQRFSFSCVCSDLYVVPS